MYALSGLFVFLPVILGLGGMLWVVVTIERIKRDVCAIRGLLEHDPDRFTGPFG